MVKERRLFVRFLLSGKILIQSDPEKTNTLDCELIDLSFDGVGLYSPEKLAAGKKVKFVIINRQLNVNLGGLAAVIFANPDKFNGKDCFRVGLEFLEVDRDRIRAILKNVRG